MPDRPETQSTGELVDDVMRRTQEAVRRSQEALESGARATAEIHELERRARDAMDWRKQVRLHPWAAFGMACGAVLLLWMLVRPRR